MTKLVGDFTGATLYLDAMVPYALLRGIEPTVQALFTRLQAGELSAYTSVLTFDELTYRLLLALIRDHYGGSPLDRLRDQEEKLIAEFYPQLASPLAQLRAFPNLSLVDVTASDLDAMNEAILQFHLRPRDALHLAAMHKCGCFDLVSHDTDFDRVPMIRRYTL
jgi:predicted nucleic acid-binding protein